MWQAGSFFLILASFVLVQRQLRLLGGDTLSHVAVLLIWVRLAAAALGEMALHTQIAGFSLMALSTLATTCLGLCLVPLHLLRVGWVAPFYAFIGFGVFSGLINGSADALLNFLVLWTYFVLVALLLYRAFLVHGHRAVLRCLLAASVLPFAMQALSLVLKMPKVAPDGTLNYIGGYGHEAIFALVALCALWMAVVYPWARGARGPIVVAAIVVGMVLANYRTIIIAILPLLLAYLLFRSGIRPMRAIKRAILPLIVGVAVVSAVVPDSIGSRFSEIGTVAGNIGDLVKPPQEFTALEKDVLSARAYIWAVYFHGFLNADTAQFIVGHGPESRAPGMSVHAHNEYLRILYEFGVVGAVFWFWGLLSLMVLALRAGSYPAGILTSAGFVAVLLASLGTSVFNRPEGIILLAVLCATTWSLADQRGLALPSGRGRGRRRFRPVRAGQIAE